MLFDTPAFILFLIVVVIVYWRLPWRKQNLMLLAASYFFYGWWDWRFLLLMMFSTVVDYFLAHRIAIVEKKQVPAEHRKLTKAYRAFHTKYGKPPSVTAMRKSGLTGKSRESYELAVRQGLLAIRLWLLVRFGIRKVDDLDTECCNVPIHQDIPKLI